jgi:predicted nicotinamide N-methyase
MEVQAEVLPEVLLEVPSDPLPREAPLPLLTPEFRHAQSVDIHEELSLSIQSIRRQELITRVNQKKIAKDQDITGLKLWDFGLEFARYLAARPSFFTNKTIMELGAGCGTLSLALAATATGAVSFTVTDAAEDALGLIRANVALNQNKLVANVNVTKCWWTVEETETPVLPVDVVLGTDLLYHLTTVEALFATAARSLKDDGGIFFLGGMSRYYGTIASMRETAGKLNLILRYVSLRQMHIPYCDGMFLAIIAQDESFIAPVIQALDLHIDATVSDDFEEKGSDY